MNNGTPKRPVPPKKQPAEPHVPFAKKLPKPEPPPGPKSGRKVTEDGGLPPMLTISELLAKNYPRPAELIAGVLHRRSKMTIAGGSKTYKTWAMLDLALSVATGTPWWDFPTTKGRVLYLNFELDDFFFQERVTAILEAKDVSVEPANFASMTFRGWIIDALVLEAVATRVRNEDFSLIVIDPLYKLLEGRDENSAGDVALMLNELGVLAADIGAALLIAHHFSKGNQAGKESIDRMSGSGVFHRDPDSLLMLTKHETEGAFVVECTLRNFRPVEPFCVQWAEPLLVRADLDPARLKAAKPNEQKYKDEDILAPLRDNGEMAHQVWREEVCDATGMSTATFAIRRRSLFARGLIQKNGDLWSETPGPKTIKTATGRKTSFVTEPQDAE